ncbi:TlpA family protein disulfide reductase [Paenibacillus pinistramenti]|uniref:TlpA family protein disulfide reductase n=1 Tax=Paenibacillus pinistramenti TaxID=1768003 RepID=UPI001107E511|nr:TlpA disulfide reductase family protein [Paenibacillus pinistramenti]
MKEKILPLHTLGGKMAFVFICSITITLWSGQAAAAKGTGLEIGKTAPAFELKGLDGQTYRVEGRRDKVLLLNFWASWCEPCRLEAPDLEHLAEKYETELDLYGVNVTAYDEEAQVKSFVEQYGVHYPILMDRKEKVYAKYEGQAFPTQVLIGRDGLVRDIIIGLLPPEELEERIRRVLDAEETGSRQPGGGP